VRGYVCDGLDGGRGTLVGDARGAADAAGADAATGAERCGAVCIASLRGWAAERCGCGS
jgi:hypothetical protein